jgi:tetratricopeptide (TPR) repeat protein
MNSMTLFLGILLVPISLGVYQVWAYHRQNTRNLAWAQAEIAKSKPDPRAYSVMGGILLGRNQLQEALPLLEKAADLETADRSSAADHLNLANVLYLGAAKGFSWGSRDKSLAAIKQGLDLAVHLPSGPAGAAYYEAGKLYLRWGLRPEAQAALRRACELQKDDWVDLGGGKGYKFEGLANVYAKDAMLAAEGK